jgi:ABC-2 type transport system permease protein
MEVSVPPITAPPVAVLPDDRRGVAALLADTRRHALLFFDYFTQYAKVRVSYRGDFFISLITSFAATIFGLAFVIVLFQKVPQLAGWRFEEVLFLYGFSLIPYGLFNVISTNLYDFGNNYIIEGKFDRILLRPISSLFQILFETFRIESLQEVATGVFCVAWASVRLHTAWTPGKFALFLFFGICAGIIYISVFLILTAVSFWFEDRIGVHPPVWNVIAFGRYPLSIYSGVVQFFLCWIIPFGLASFYPSVRMLGRTVSPEYAPFVPVVAAAFFTIAISLWNLGTRHYSSTGS